MGRRSDEGRFTLAYCEELLRQNPTATAGIYHRVRKELREMEAKEADQINEATPTDVLAAVNVSVNRESSHRWDVRAALLDGPKTAQQCANWARERGNQHIDRPLAENILRNLVRNEEVGIDVTVNAGKPTVFVATDNMKRPTEQPMGIGPPQTLPEPSPDPAARRAILAEVEYVTAQCGRIPPNGGTLTTSIPEGVVARDFAQSVRVRLLCWRITKPYSWSVNQLPNGKLQITSRGLKQPEAPPPLAPTEATGDLDALQPIPQGVALAPLPAEPTAAIPGRRWDAGYSLLDEIDAKIAKLKECRESVERVIPLMEQRL